MKPCDGCSEHRSTRLYAVRPRGEPVERNTVVRYCDACATIAASGMTEAPLTVELAEDPTARRYRITFQEVVTYTVEVVGDEMDVARRWVEIDRFGDFHPLENFDSVEERELGSVREVGADGEPLPGTRDIAEDIAILADELED